jgi:hypothetical protein
MTEDAASAEHRGPCPYTGTMSNFRVEEHPVTQSGYVLPQSMGGGVIRTATCEQCGGAAAALHNKPECHTCSDWNGCGRDCTWSGWRCDHCGITEGFSYVKACNAAHYRPTVL